MRAPSNSVVPDSRNLDLLRAVAVLCVFFAHLILCLIDTGHYHVSAYQLWNIELTELGHVGVLFFFVHTALVLMMSLERTPERRLVLNFYVRRVFRIYPLSISCIIAVLLLHVPQVPDGTFVPWSWSEIVANLLLIQNILRKADVIMPLWTLPREVQMYLVLPFLYLLLKRFPSSVLVLVLWFASFAAANSTPLLSCVPCFLGGVFAYQLSKERTFALPGSAWPASIAVLFVLHAVSMMTIFPDYRSDYLLCMFLGAVIPNVVNLKKSRLTACCHTIAKYSYGIYLCHDPVLWISFVKLKSLPVAVQWATLVLLMVAIPVGAYTLIEAPLIGIGRRLAERWSGFFAPRPFQFPVAGIETGVR